MKKAVILGCGRIGSVMARDLSTDFNVLVADADEKVLGEFHAAFGMEVLHVDLSKQGGVEKAVSDADVVICAVPGFMGFDTLRRIIEAGKDVVDISFFNEDPFPLEELAREKGVRAVIDCGVAPGLSNMVLGRHVADQKVLSYACYVGGLPVERIPPFEYKAPFSPVDVIAEYTRPARLVRNGQLLVLDALSERELMEFEGIGTLEAFNSDGLRSIVKTMQVPNMVEKTLRYPGHAQLMESFREGGFFSEENLDVKGNQVRILDFTSAILFRQWKQRPDEEEFTVMKIDLQAEKEGFTYYILDRGDMKLNMSSMARLTGFTCTSTLRFLMQNDIPAGLWPPELLASKFNLLDHVIRDLKKKGVGIEIQQVKIN